MPRDARKREVLYQHDVGVARIRRALVNRSKAQLAARCRRRQIGKLKLFRTSHGLCG
jgi:hypothetical protein